MRPPARASGVLLACLLALGPSQGAVAAESVETFATQTGGCVGYVLLPNQAPQQSCGDIPLGAAKSDATASADGHLKVHASASGGVEAIARWAISSARLQGAHTLDADASGVDVSWPFTMIWWDSSGSRQFLPPLFATQYGILDGTMSTDGGACTDGSSPEQSGITLQFFGVPDQYVFQGHIRCGGDADLVAGSVVSASIYLEAEVQAPMMAAVHADIELRAGVLTFHAA